MESLCCLVKAPSLKTLIVLTVLSFLATSILMPEWYPPPIPVLGPDGSVMHGPDGKVLVHRDLTRFNREAVPGEIFFCCTIILVGWLVIRLFLFINERLGGRRQRSGTVLEPKTDTIKHPQDLVDRTAALILNKFDVTPERARRLAERAMDGIDSHGGDPHDWETIQSVVEVVVRSWVEKNLVP